MAAVRFASVARWGSSRLAVPAFRRQMATISAAQVKELREATGAPILQCKVALQQPDIDGDFDAAVRWLREQGMGKAAKKASRQAAEGLVGVKMNAAGDEAVLVELNSETDFVARNELFRDCLNSILDVALTTATTDSSSPDTLAASTAFNPETQSDDTVSNILVGATAKMGENMVLRRATKVVAENGVVVTYTHNNTHDQQGSIGVAVALGGASYDASSHQDALKAIGKTVAMHVAAANPAFLDSSSVTPEVYEAEKSIIEAQNADSGKPADVMEKIISGRMRKFLAEICLVDQKCMLDPEGRTVAKFLKDGLKEKGLPADIQLQQFAVFVRGTA